MKIASFNINGIKARLPALLDWLREAAPDVAMLQEIKSMDEVFPREEIEALGYEIHTHGMKGFNGVAMLSKTPLEDVMRGLPGDDEDIQTRYIEATVIGDKGAVRLCNLYLPNGNPVPGPKYDYKLAWMARLYDRAVALMAAEEPFLMAGDYNIIPQAIDCWDTAPWLEDAAYLPASRAAYRKILNLGFTDAFRVRNNAAMNYTFWDYQAGAWNKNNGIRIDHFLLSPSCADILVDCQVDRECRAKEKPSDHVPVWVELDI
tara:strand:- start:15101 stop:15883 length:783 start_codon:yes stop_codon:yes gene_type:complete